MTDAPAYIPSVDPRGPVDSLRNYVANHGALVVRGLLPFDEVSSLGKHTLSLVLGSRWGQPDNDGVRGRGRVGSRGWWEMYRAVQSLEQLHRLAHSPELHGVVSRILDRRRLLNHARRPVAIVGPSMHVRPYQDHMTVQGTPDVISAWIPLSDVPTAWGPEIASGPPPERLLPLTVDDEGGVGIECPDYDWIRPENPLRPGDVLLVHSLCVRRIPSNSESAPQLALEARLQGAYEPVTEASLLPHHYPRVPAWGSTASGWNDRSWIATPRIKHVVPFVVPRTMETWHLDVPRRKSRLLGDRGSGR